MRYDVTQEADGQAIVAATAMGKLMGLVNRAGIATGRKSVGKCRQPSRPPGMNGSKKPG